MTHASSSSSWSVGNRLIRKPPSSLAAFWAFMLPISRASRFSSSLARRFGLSSVCSRTQRAWIFFFFFRVNLFFFQHSKLYLERGQRVSRSGLLPSQKGSWTCASPPDALHWTFKVKENTCEGRSITRVCVFIVCADASSRGTCWFPAWWLCHRAGPKILLWWGWCNFLLMGTHSASLLCPCSQTSCGNRKHMMLLIHQSYLRI